MIVFQSTEMNQKIKRLVEDMVSPRSFYGGEVDVSSLQDSIYWGIIEAIAEERESCAVAVQEVSSEAAAIIRSKQE